MYPNQISQTKIRYGLLLLANIILIQLIGKQSQMKTAEAFQCYVCDTKDNIECIEKLPANSRLTPKNCSNIADAKYCIKTTNIYAGEFGTKRFCAANDHGNYCGYVKEPTGVREYWSCVYTCDSENCNGSDTFFNRHNTFYVAFITTLLSCVISHYANMQ